MADALRLTILLPMRMVVSRSSGFFAIAAAILLVRPLSVSSMRICRNDREVNAVSDAEKKAERNNRMTMMISCRLIVEPYGSGSDGCLAVQACGTLN